MTTLSSVLLYSSDPLFDVHLRGNEREAGASGQGIALKGNLKGILSVSVWTLKKKGAKAPFFNMQRYHYRD